MLKKWFVWGMIAFVVFFVAFKPSSAAGAVKTLGQAAIDIFEGVGGFFSSLVS